MPSLIARLTATAQLHANRPALVWVNTADPTNPVLEQWTYARVWAQVLPLLRQAVLRGVPFAFPSLRVVSPGNPVCGGAAHTGQGKNSAG